MGDYPAARAHYEAALAAQESVATPRRRRYPSSPGDRGQTAKPLEEAVALYQQSLELCSALGDRWGEAAAHNNLGLVAATNGDFAEATRQYSAALAILRGENDHWGVASVLNNLGLLSREQGDYAQAADHFMEALGIRRALDDRPGTAATTNNLGLVAFDRGEFSKGTGAARRKPCPRPSHRRQGRGCGLLQQPC